MAPETPYGAAKAYGHFIVQGYRRRYGLFCCSGILYNHKSWRRPPTFVTRKISRGAAAIRLGLERTLSLGNLDARRDWGFAGDYVRAMWLMLQANQPDDYIVATGRSHSVRDVVQWAFDHVNLDWRDHVVVDGRLKRGVLDLQDMSAIRRGLGRLFTGAATCRSPRSSLAWSTMISKTWRPVPDQGRFQSRKSAATLRTAEPRAELPDRVHALGTEEFPESQPRRDGQSQDER